MLANGRHILAFDPTGKGRAAEVFGDLDRAARVSVIVPGVDTPPATGGAPGGTGGTQLGGTGDGRTYVFPFLRRSRGSRCG